MRVPARPGGAGTVLVTILLLWLPCGLPAGNPDRGTVGSTPYGLERFREAVRMNEFSRFGAAAEILAELHRDLTARGQLDSPFGLAVRSETAYVWERHQRLGEATAELLDVIEQASARGLPDIEAYALLLMALIHEEQHDPDHCREYLDRAARLVDEAALDRLEALLFLRSASYHRLYGDPREALRFARRALRAAVKHRQEFHQGTAHLLLSILLRDSDLARSRDHLDRAAALYARNESDVNSLVVALNQANVAQRDGDLPRALAFVEAALTYYQRSQHSGGGAEEYGALAFLQHGELLRHMGQLDSAIVSLERGRSMQIAQLDSRSRLRMSEVEARYLDGRREARLKEQARLLDFRKRRETWMLWTLLAVVVGLAVLWFNYLRLRRAQRDVSQQRDVIAQQNTALAGALREQQLLRGELHHRVKNNLQIIIGLLDLHIGEIGDPALRRGLESTIGRVYSIAAIHDILYREDRVGVIHFRRYVEKLTEHVRALSTGNVDCTFDLRIPDWEFDLETAIPLGTILNELLTNSFKYGTGAGRRLRIRIALERSGDDYRLVYGDDGPGYPGGSLRERGGGLGTYLLEGMVRQLGGRVTTANAGGACCTIEFSYTNGDTAESGALQLDPKSPHFSTMTS